MFTQEYLKIVTDRNNYRSEHEHGLCNQSHVADLKTLLTFTLACLAETNKK
jgi:hypothetical protein